MAQSFYLDVSSAAPATSPISGKITQIAAIVDSAGTFVLTDDVQQNHTVFQIKNASGTVVSLVIPVDIPVKAGTPLSGLNGWATLTISP